MASHDGPQQGLHRLHTHWRLNVIWPPHWDCVFFTFALRLIVVQEKLDNGMPHHAYRTPAPRTRLQRVSKPCCTLSLLKKSCANMASKDGPHTRFTCIYKADTPSPDWVISALQILPLPSTEAVQTWYRKSHMIHGPHIGTHWHGLKHPETHWNAFKCMEYRILKRLEPDRNTLKHIETQGSTLTHIGGETDWHTLKQLETYWNTVGQIKTPWNT